MQKARIKAYLSLIYNSRIKTSLRKICILCYPFACFRRLHTLVNQTFRHSYCLLKGNTAAIFTLLSAFNYQHIFAFWIVRLIIENCLGDCHSQDFFIYLCQFTAKRNFSIPEIFKKIFQRIAKLMRSFIKNQSSRIVLYIFKMLVSLFFIN